MVEWKVLSLKKGYILYSQKYPKSKLTFEIHNFLNEFIINADLI